MEPTLPTISTTGPGAQTQTEVDDRFVALCTKIKLKAEGLREEVFQAIEKDDYTTAIKPLDQIRDLDRLYMLSLQRGMGLVETTRKEKEKAAALSRAVETENRIGATSQVDRQKSFFGKLFGGSK